MTEDHQDATGTETDKARIVRTFYDAIDIVMRDPASEKAAGARHALARLLEDADARQDAEFSSRLRSALRRLLPDDPAGGAT